jgi:hypothetical protein
MFKKLLESQLEIEKEKTEADAKKLQNIILEYAKEKESEQQKKSSNISIPQSPSIMTTLKLGARQNDLLFSNEESSNFLNKQTSVYDYLRMFLNSFKVNLSFDSLFFKVHQVQSTHSKVYNQD